MAVGAHDCHFFSASLLSGSSLTCWLPSGLFGLVFFRDGLLPGSSPSFELSSVGRARFLVPANDGLDCFEVLETLAGPGFSDGALVESLDERRMLSMVVLRYVSTEQRLRRSTRRNIKIARCTYCIVVKAQGLEFQPPAPCRHHRCNIVWRYPGF